jgi:CubicO group peptidase (beta-lactamase class C family)
VDLSDPVVRELLKEAQSIPDMVEFLNSAEGHQMEFGGAGGIASARSVAKVYAATIGEIDSIQLLSTQTLDFVTQPRTARLGPVPQLATVPNQKIAEFGLGFWLGSQFASKRFESGGTFGHPGAGGNIGFAHPESNMAAAYTCTGMWSDESRPDTRMSWAEPLADLAGDTRRSHWR